MFSPRAAAEDFGMAKISKTAQPPASNFAVARQIGHLVRERAKLKEEVLQLRAAVKIWTAVCIQTKSNVTNSEAQRGEMR